LSVVRVSKIRLYPNASQEVVLLDVLRICKDAWNALKTLIQEEYENTGKTLGYYDLCHKLTILKQVERKYQLPHSQVIRNVATRITGAYKSFFATRKKGLRSRLPRYKSVERYHSFTYPQFGFQFSNDKAQLSKIGSIKYRGTIPKGKIKTFTVKHTKSGKWIGYITYEKELEPFDANLPVVGIDLGLKRFATLSDGQYIPAPQFYRKDENRIRRAHRELSRKKRGSKNREKAKISLAKIYEGVSNRRLDFLHKTSTWLANHYSIICVEDLNIKGLSQSLRLGKSIHDASWGKFLSLLEYKLNERNGLLIKVNPRNTSQLCSRCGKKVEKDLSIRIHCCPFCGLTLDRDLNASINVLKIGADCAELTPVESTITTHPLRIVQIGSMKQESQKWML